MSHRRVDAIYIVLLLAVCAISYYAANRPLDPSQEGVPLDLPDFHLPPLVLEVPFDLPFTIVKFESLAAPTLDLSNNMESALSEIRSALLESSTPVEVESVERLVAAIE